MVTLIMIVSEDDFNISNYYFDIASVMFILA